MKLLIQKLLLGYRPNPKATAPRSGTRLTQPGGTAEQIHSALVLMKYNMQHGKQSIKTRNRKISRYISDAYVNVIRPEIIKPRTLGYVAKAQCRTNTNRTCNDF